MLFKLKRRIPVFLVALLILSMFSANVLAASSKYKFDMKQRVVDGKKNKEFHNLSAGNAYISGSHRIYQSKYPDAKKEKIHYTLVENKLGFDKEISTITKPNNSYNTSVSGGFGKINKGKYYLRIWKTNRDWHYTEGSGTVRN